MAISPDGQLVATASQDKTVRVWAMKKGRFLGQLVGHKTSVQRLAFSLDGKRILSSGSGSGGVRIWDVPDPSPADLLRRTGAITNYRVCKKNLSVVPVLPFPEPDNVWADEIDPTLCTKGARQ